MAEQETSIDVDAFKSRLEQLKSHDVSSTTFDDYKRIVASEIDTIMGFRKTLAAAISKAQQKANDKIAVGRKQNYREDNPFLQAAEMIIEAMNNTIDQLSWSDLQMELYETEREKLYSLISKLVKENAKVEIIKQEKERDKQAFDEIKGWLKEQKEDLRAERDKLIAENFISKSEFNKLKNTIGQITSNGIDIEKLVKQVTDFQQLTEQLQQRVDDLQDKVGSTETQQQVQQVIEKNQPEESLQSLTNLPAEGTALRKIYDWVEQHPNIAHTEVIGTLSEQLNKPRNTILSMLKNLKDRQLLKKEGDTWQVM